MISCTLYLGQQLKLLIEYEKAVLNGRFQESSPSPHNHDDGHVREG